MLLDTWIDRIRWNVSTRKRARFVNAEFIVVTLPKSGTTWLRVFLYSYFCGLTHRAFTLRSKSLAGSGVPRVVFTHDLFDHAAEPSLTARVRGRHLIPPRERRATPRLLLVRDPRDVLVSLYFELSKRGDQPRYTGTLADMIRDRKFGIGKLVEIMNSWLRDWGHAPDFTLVRYEECLLEPEPTFRRVLGFLGFREVDEPLLKQSMEFAGFDNMRRMEAARAFDDARLSRADPRDPDSFRVRRGVIGGYKDYLSMPQIDVLNEAIAQLDQRYGYR